MDRLLGSALAETKKSVLLLGPRQTGKSTLCATLKPDLAINLAREDVFLEHAHNASLLAQELDERRPSLVFVDEIQRLPSLLNSIQAHLDEAKSQARPLRFLLTGSSARKLRRGNANLLPGRVVVFELGPLIAAELDYRLDTARALSLGCLPEPYLEPDRRDAERLLRSYAATYLKEEIQAEALTRNIEGFSRFLHVAAMHSGQFLDFSKLSQQAKVSRTGCVRFFEILEDTLIAQRVPTFDAASTADLVKHPRYFFFDVGVLNGLLGDFGVSPTRAGFLFEHLLYSQIRIAAAARERTCEIFGFRTRGGLEIDFVVQLEHQTWAVEAKSGHYDAERCAGTFEQARRYLPDNTQYVVAHTGTERRRVGNCRILPWQTLLTEMGL